MSEKNVSENNETTADDSVKSLSPEDVNRIVAERLAREREKFADYDDLKAKAEELVKVQETKTVLEQSQTEKVAEWEAEKRSLLLGKDRAEVAAAEGVPVELITGESRDEFVESAQKLKEWRGSNYVVPAEGGSGSAVALNSDALEDSLKKILGMS